VKVLPTTAREEMASIVCTTIVVPAGIVVAMEDAIQAQLAIAIRANVLLTIFKLFHRLPLHVNANHSIMRAAENLPFFSFVTRRIPVELGLYCGAERDCAAAPHNSLWCMKGSSSAGKCYQGQTI
jgi:hypothetical protein